MSNVQTRFTRADYDQLPEGFPAQLIDGNLVKEPAPTYGHQALVSRLHVALTPLVGRDLVLQSPVNVVLDDENVLQPDLVVLGRRPALADRNVGIPRLAVEVLSPSTKRRDRRVKAAKLVRAGVIEVWIVDPDEKTVEVRTRDGGDLYRGDERATSTVVDGFSVIPSELFLA